MDVFSLNEIKYETYKSDKNCRKMSKNVKFTAYQFSR